MPGELEHTYYGVFQKFVAMLRVGSFPFAHEDAESEESPRVGDGVIVVDNRGRIAFTSPNAVSALHRIGFHANAVGRELEDVGFHADALRTAFRLQVPITEEIERGPSVSILARVLPLIDDDRVDGAIVLLRDVSELRRQERLLVSMDATIREIHHRVKNNLQTVSSLLRLQGRRMESIEAKAAIEESVRRIRSIALVHEILARKGGDDVSFGEVVRPIVSMVEQALVAPDRPISFSVVGDGPTLPATTVSSLAVILTELLQNAVEHGYPPGSSGGRVVVELETAPHELVVRVHDDGVGLRDDFDLETQTGLGLTIVRTLASGELHGDVSLRPAVAGARGAVAQLKVSLDDIG
jgi:two-component sensor histidine kinase